MGVLSPGSYFKSGQGPPDMGEHTSQCFLYLKVCLELLKFNMKLKKISSKGNETEFYFPTPFNCYPSQYDLKNFSCSWKV